MSNMNWYKWMCAALLVQAALFAWGQTPTRAMQVGDKWVYRFEDPGNKKPAVEQLTQVVHVDGANAWMYSNDAARPPGQQETMVRWDQVRGWRMEGFELDKSKPLAMGKRLWNAQPDDDWFQFSLTDGKNYKVKRNWPNGEGYDEYTAQVGPLLPVKVKAGTFNAHEVVFKGRWYRTSGGNSSGNTEMTQYWSPDLGRVLKGVFRNWNPNGSLWDNNNWELVRWEPQAELVFKPAVGAQ